MRTPRGRFNRMVVSITVCEPGTDRCATIDDVMVDTGSTGLRLEARARLETGRPGTCQFHTEPAALSVQQSQRKLVHPRDSGDQAQAES